MTRAVDRAVAVALHEGKVLVIRRHRNAKDYCVLPGGGVKPDEAPRDAVLRELAEETGLSGVVVRELWTLEHRDRRAHYFLVAAPHGPMAVAGPEALRQDASNSYTPDWVSLDELDAVDLQPAEVRHLLGSALG
jgi:8-oxo-dGTP pyrophosphatase MutT (NUDIX family)